MSPRYKHLCLNMVVLAGLLAANPAQSLAASYAEPSIPPEIVYAHDLRQRVTVPGRVNINTAPMTELLSLPGMDENLALKLIRLRPIQNKEDFLKMPFISPRSVEMLIQRLDGKIEY